MTSSTIHINFLKVFTFHEESVRDGMIMVPYARYAMTIGHFKPCWGSGGTNPGDEATRNLRNLAFSGHRIEDKTTLIERILICWLYSRKNNYQETFVKFLTLCPGVGLLTPCFVPRERVFVHNDCPEGRVFAPFESCPGGLSWGGWFWMKLIPA